MDKNLFDKLVESMEQMGEIMRDERASSCELHFDTVSAEENSDVSGSPEMQVAD